MLIVRVFRCPEILFRFVDDSFFLNHIFSFFSFPFSQDHQPSSEAIAVLCSFSKCEKDRKKFSLKETLLKDLTKCILKYRCCFDSSLSVYSSQLLRLYTVVLPRRCPMLLQVDQRSQTRGPQEGPNAACEHLKILQFFIIYRPFAYFFNYF